MMHFSIKAYIVGTLSRRLGESLQIGTHNICFSGKLEIIITRNITRFSYLTSQYFSRPTGSVFVYSELNGL